ncbi:CAP-associated domain-containing protein [Paenibacillus wynnii]|uniref:CAP-associated domain-containing protein n=1 Tax=Paenibacillus wynnii TaxID=268407 RepID=UPI0027918E59|nr:CAP-associated domain-containing protein [Paenibacillus wynnii]MDQ0192806.1 outer membrane protein assembly factor BamE (lipoprotein component of BamABCDE complex) [Paenibacillus wynnii]
MTVSDSFHVNAAASNVNAVNGSIIQHPYLTIQVLKEKKPIYIRPGMTKQKVDQLLGKPIEIEYPGFRGYAYGNSTSTIHVTVGYLNGKVASIYTSGYEISLNGQFKFGTPWKNVLTKLGPPSQVKENTYDYVFQLINGKLRRIYGTAIQEGKGKTDVYTLRFYISESGNVRGISVVQAA